MIRILFSVLAVVVVVLAVLLKAPLLYAAAAMLMVIVVILWITVLQQRHRETAPPYTPVTSAPPLPEEDLQSLGIVGIRPKEPSPKPVGGSNGAPVEAPRPATPSLKEFVARPLEARPIAAKAAAKTTAESTAEEALALTLHALCTALGAHTVGVLKQEDIAPDYQIVTLVGDGATAKRDGTFSSEMPLLTARMARQPVTVQPVGPGGLAPSSLGYSRAPDVVREIALAPVPHPSETETYLLLADTLRDDHLSQAPAPALLYAFARLLGTLLDTLSLTAPATSPRPRREIIAEEMARARARNQVLALALVYLNRAEALAEAGEEDVKEAERLLEARLQEATGHRRVERFGELTYGVFYDGDLPEVEAWGAQVQRALAEETGLLEGGVSIGIALMQDRHEHPDDLRADATNALREAYETGTCTILE